MTDAACSRATSPPGSDRRYASQSAAERRSGAAAAAAEAVGVAPAADTLMAASEEVRLSSPPMAPEPAAPLCSSA